jgi:hypothetical protein
MILRRMQALLARLYDAHVEQRPEEFLISDRDEQVFIVEGREGVRVGLFIDSQVLERLDAHDPLDRLDEGNLQDFCTALEGVSHFHYLMWSVSRGRDVSLLELELQAEVDKYASALTLLTRQRDGEYPRTLHARLFDRVSYLPQSCAETRDRYEAANRHAARYCRALDGRYLRPRMRRPEAWLAELRRFFRCAHQQKLHAATR